MRIKTGVFLSIFTALSLILTTPVTANTSFAPIKQKIAQIQPGDERPEVVLFFMYTCPHCHSLEAHIDKADWLTDANASHNFVRVPVQFNGDSFVRLHYSLIQLGMAEKDVSMALFLLGEKSNRRQVALKNDTDYARYAAERFPVSEEGIQDALKSFSVKLKTRQAMRHFVASGATGVPVVTVKGQYRVDGNSAGSQAGMIDAVQSLVKGDQ